MANKRGRNRNEFGSFFSVYNVGGGPPIAGQPVMIRMQGVPTMAGYRDRPGKWNVIIPPILALIADLIERIKA